MDSPAISVEKLVKIYPGGTRAVAGVDFAVARGEFFGFLGPNGAGKSTTLKILTTLLRKTSGRFMVAGYDGDRDPTNVRRSIGFAMQEVGLDDLAPGRDFLVLQGLLYGQSYREAKRRAGELLELIGLSEVAARKVGTYSSGMRRRIDLAAALMHSPPVLFLDEPTTGLDPQSRLAIWEHLEGLNRGGTTILLTTQMMEEADRLCQRIAIIDEGHIVKQGSPRSLKAELGGDTVTLSLGLDGSGGAGAQVTKAEVLLRERGHLVSTDGQGKSLTVQVPDGAAATPHLLHLLQENDIPVANISVTSPTLDDVFFRYTGRKIRPQEASGDAVGQARRPWLGLGKR